MASPSTKSNDSQKEHEVFLSFRGEDTRNTFTGHLNAALKRYAIRTYIDHNLKRGDEISHTLLNAIEKANLSVIVFSKTFATSKWCLDEVGQIVVPIFYHVDPSMLGNQTGSNMEKVQRWRKALTDAANHSGWECSLNSIEYEIVEKIAKDVSEKPDHVYVGDLNSQIAMYEQLKKIQVKIF
ncbi:hypothetical protein AAZX31_08G285200 [Glycine max]